MAAQPSSIRTAGIDSATSELDALDCRVAALRLRAQPDPVGAHDEAWSWINEVSAFVPYERNMALATLDPMHRVGRPCAEFADGQNIFGVANTTTNPVVDRLMRAILSLWQPWHGKQWSAARPPPLASAG
ncbi:hypothetical protein [Nocardia sp. XZ_19_231]|uniref:hypothetical protein n=1 Tax=Nocardia sp. XZ_19_231 TaxID=2769252 RepID=UPI00188FD3D0|nr:hypothetical protein [Nocardia sp. XZ_19_231]